MILHGEAENDQLFSAFFSAVSIAFKRIMEVYNSQDDSKKKENAGVYNFLHM